MKKVPEKFILLRQVFLVVAMGMVPGCLTPASVPTLPLDENIRAKKYRPSETEGLIYVYRPYQWTGQLGLDRILINGQDVGILGSDNYLLVIVPPGTHLIHTGYDNSPEVTIEVQPKSIHYVKSFAVGHFDSSPIKINPFATPAKVTVVAHLEHVNVEIGKEDVKNLIQVI